MIKSEPRMVDRAARAMDITWMSRELGDWVLNGRRRIVVALTGREPFAWSPGHQGGGLVPSARSARRQKTKVQWIIPWTMVPEHASPTPGAGLLRAARRQLGQSIRLAVDIGCPVVQWPSVDLQHALY